MTEDDKELLLLAAKAGEMELWPGNAFRAPGLLLACGSTCWNPKNNEVDAIRLAVKLDLLILPYPEEKAVLVTRLDQPEAIIYWSECRDKVEATCWAITYAAAEIGSKLP